MFFDSISPSLNLLKKKTLKNKPFFNSFTMKNAEGMLVAPGMISKILVVTP